MGITRISNGELYLKNDNPRYLTLKKLYGETHDIEIFAGTSIDLEFLNDNESVVIGDGESYYFKLTEK